MNLENVPYLCGGTLFCLILESLKPRTKARNKFDGGSDGLAETDVMGALISIINNTTNDLPEGNTLKTCTSRYKKCELKDNTYINFTDDSIIQSFNNLVDEKNPEILVRTSEFINKYIDNNKLEWFVKALIELISKDKEIPDDYIFNISNYKKCNKAILETIQRCNLPFFMLSVLQYILNNRKDNTKGSNTFNSWYKNSGPRTQYNFISNIGKENTNKIEVLNNVKELNGDNSFNKNEKSYKATITQTINFNDNSEVYCAYDNDILNEFTTDYMPIIMTILSDSFADSLIDRSLQSKISKLYNKKWKSQVNSFMDLTLKGYAFELLGLLNNLSSNDSNIKFLKFKDSIKNILYKLCPQNYNPEYPCELEKLEWYEN